MNALERLGAELRRELGSPPEAFAERQRARLREARESSQQSVLQSGFRRGGVSTPLWRRWYLAPTLALCATVGALLWWGSAPESADRVAVANLWLNAEELQGPYRLPDGSSISLDPGAQGRLSSSTQAVRFDLVKGRATFDVTPRRGQEWRISAGDYGITVVGTRFVVEFASNDALSVHVEHGVVLVQTPQQHEPIRLLAGARFETSKSLASVQPAATGTETSNPTPAESAPPKISEKPTAEETWRTLYKSGQYEAALAMAKELGFESLMRQLSAEPLADLADTARLGGSPELAVQSLTALQQRFPAAAPARDVNFLLGRVYAAQGQRQRAIDAFEAYLEAAEKGAYANETLGRLMQLYSSAGNTARARQMATRYLQRAPEGPYQRLANSVLRSDR